MVKYLALILLIANSFRLCGQVSEFDTFFCHDTKNRLVSFNTGFYTCYFHKRKLVSMVTADSCFGYDNKNKIFIIKQSIGANTISLWKHKGIYLTTQDTVYRIDSLHLLTPAIHKDSVLGNTIVDVHRDSFEIIVFYDKLRLKSTAFFINGKAYMIDFYFDQENGFIEEIKEINQQYKFYLIFRYLHPSMIFYQNIATSKTVSLAADYRGKFYDVVMDRAVHEDNMITNKYSKILYYYNWRGKLKKKYSTGRVFYCK